MDNFLINKIGMGNQSGAPGKTSLKEGAGTESNKKDFLSVFTSMLSGSENKEVFLNKLKEIQESGEPGLANAISSLSTLLLSMVPADVGTKGAETTGQKLIESIEGNASHEVLLSGSNADKATKGFEREGQEEIEKLTAFQEEMSKLLSFLNDKSEATTGKGKVPVINNVGKMTLQNVDNINLKQALLKETGNDENEAIQAQNTGGIPDLLTKDIIERNAVLLRAIAENGGKVNHEGSSKGNDRAKNTTLDGLLKPGEAGTPAKVSPSFNTGEGLDERSGENHEGQDRALIISAAKKYKEHLPGTDEINANTHDETTNVSAQKGNSEVPQGDSFRSNVFQVKDNNITFEKGSFTSFVTDRIEKIVEQFSSKSSQMDMVVRLKLDDKETLLVGLRHEGQKVIVDVRASNDGLVNLLQAHKDDIARSLQDKNIFTSIFVQPDGEQNSQRYNQQDKNKEDRKQEASTSFVSILEATA